MILFPILWLSLVALGLWDVRERVKSGDPTLWQGDPRQL